MTANAQTFSPVNGQYVGSFLSNDGSSIQIAATLSQAPAAKTDGNYTLNGSATFDANPCFTSPVQVQNTQVTGGTFTMTYPDPTTQNSVTATGTFSDDAKTLTVSSWTLSGPCGPDSGTNVTLQLQSSQAH